MIIVVTLLIYFAALFVLSRVTGRGATNDTFYRGGRRSPWYAVAFGMVGASVSGVSFVSVPGMVTTSGMTYLQTCLGFIPGYFVVAFVLLPLYYSRGLTSIYTYLDDRIGYRAYRTSACFFLFTKMVMAAVRFGVVCMILHRFVLDGTGIPFGVTAAGMVTLIWLYTHRGGIRTLVWTDTFQTVCLLTAVVLITACAAGALDFGPAGAVHAVAQSDMSRIFVFGDLMSRQNFWKQFLSGVFIVIVMTGLDQDMMQKNLTCKSLREAQKDMCAYGFAFVPVNMLLLSLGVLLVMLAGRQGVALPAAADDILPMFAATGRLGTAVVVLFTVGLVAASFSSADSAVTSLTTSYCIDIRRRADDERLRRRVHGAVCAIFAAVILVFEGINSTSVIDAIYIICSYCYGPLLGMFAFGLLTRRRACDAWMPYVAVASPAVCFAVDRVVAAFTDYRFGYELLMVNGLMTFAGLYLSGFYIKKRI